MQEHLTDEQLTGQLAGHADSLAGSHLETCGACRGELARLRRGFLEFREACSAAADRPEAFWRSQQSTITSRWASRQTTLRATWALAGVVLLATVTLWREPSPTAPPVAVDPDHALLLEVQQAVRREVPRALEPASLIAQELNEAARKKANP